MGQCIHGLYMSETCEGCGDIPTAHRLVQATAYHRGYDGCTFATADELAVPRYNELWSLGAQHRAVAR